MGVGTSPGAYADGRTTEDLTCAGAAALTDARRGLLLLRGHILEDPALRERTLWLSGPVPPVRILSERIEGGLYFIEVETALSRLLNRNGGVYVAGEMQRLKRNSAPAR